MAFDLTSVITPNYPYTVSDLGGTKAHKVDGIKYKAEPGILGKKYDWVLRRIVNNPRYTGNGVYWDPNPCGHRSNIQIFGWVVIEVYKDRERRMKKKAA